MSQPTWRIFADDAAVSTELQRVIDADPAHYQQIRDARAQRMRAQEEAHEAERAVARVKEAKHRAVRKTRDQLLTEANKKRQATARRNLRLVSHDATWPLPVTEDEAQQAIADSAELIALYESRGLTTTAAERFAAVQRAWTTKHASARRRWLMYYDFVEGWSGAQIATHIGRCRNRAFQLCRHNERILVRLLHRIRGATRTGVKPALEDLDLSARAWNVLQNNGITDTDALCRCTEATILKWKNTGRKTLNEIKNELYRHGLMLGETK